MSSTKKTITRPRASSAARIRVPLWLNSPLGTLTIRFSAIGTLSRYSTVPSAEALSMNSTS